VPALSTIVQKGNIVERSDKRVPEVLVMGCTVPAWLPTMNCGGTPVIDSESSIGAYRCDMCGAVVGSVGQPKHCKEINE
jgi:hypothetical protein